MLNPIAPHQVKYFKIDAATATIAAVAAVAGKKIRVIQWRLSNNGAAACTIKWQSASTDLTGPMSLANDVAGISGEYNPDGHFETAAGEALNLAQSGTEALGGYGCYIEV